MVLQRWDPFRELRHMEDAVNRVYRGYNDAMRESVETWNIPMDVVQKDENIEVRAAMPGVKADDIDVSVEDGVLTIRAERKTETEKEDEKFLVKECVTGSFYRALRLPDTVDTEKIESNYDNGILTVAMPKAEEKKKKQIQVKVGTGPKEIESTK